MEKVRAVSTQVVQSEGRNGRAERRNANAAAVVWRSARDGDATSSRGGPGGAELNGRPGG